MKYDVLKVPRAELTQEEKTFWSNLTRMKSPEEVLDSKRKRRKMHRAAKLAVKTEILTYYGEGKLACIRCGFSDVRALSIDHINSDGYKDRKARRNDSTRNYYRLRKLGYPGGFQTLCMNCQFIKRDEEYEYSR